MSSAAVNDTAVNDTTDSTATDGNAGFISDGTTGGIEAHAVADLVTLLTDRALALSAQAARAPSSVRISAGSVHVEICWPTSPPVPTETRASPLSSEAPSAALAAAPPVDVFPLCAGTVGTFYRTPELGAAPFVTEGDRVQPGQQVAIIEAMKLMIPVEAERAGEVVEFLVADRAPVEYGQPLMLVREVAR